MRRLVRGRTCAGAFGVHIAIILAAALFLHLQSPRSSGIVDADVSLSCRLRYRRGRYLGREPMARN